MKFVNKAAFLDRDGVINYDYGYVGKIKDFVFMPKVILGLKIIQELGFKIIIITNQSGIGRELYSLNDFHLLTKHMINVLNNNHIYLTDVMYCPHIPEENCDCRKPKTGMIRLATKKHNIDLSKSFLVGDKQTDILAGRNANIKKCFQITESQKKDKTNLFDDKFNSLYDVAIKINNYSL
jgi:D-glycero-D-manno-heptose 1,7-bisphosphate phosphatase